MRDTKPKEKLNWNSFLKENGEQIRWRISIDNQLLQERKRRRYFGPQKAEAVNEGSDTTRTDSD